MSLSDVTKLDKVTFSNVVNVLGFDGVSYFAVCAAQLCVHSRGNEPSARLRCLVALFICRSILRVGHTGVPKSNNDRLKRER